MSVNKRAYDWESTTVNLPSGPGVDIEDIEYSDSREVTEVYGKGNQAKHYGMGNYKAEGKATFLLEEWTKLRDKLGILPGGNGTIYGHAPFPITTSYKNDDQPLVTDVLRDVKLTKVSTSSKQGEAKTSVSVDFKILGGIVWNGTAAI